MSQTMSNEIQNIHYCTILSAGQWDFLLEGRFSPLRQKCLFRLMNGAVRTRTAYKIKGIDIVLEVGQVAASDSCRCAVLQAVFQYHSRWLLPMCLLV